MAFTLDDRPTLDVGTTDSPRWQRFAGGRRLAHVGYRRRLLRIALGTVGAALVGGTIALGDGRTAAETWSSAIATANEITRDATSTTESASRSVTSSWDTLASWARIDTPPRRQPPEAHAAGVATAASPTTIPSPAAAGEGLGRGLPVSSEELGKGLLSPTVTGRSGMSPIATAVPSATAAANGSPAAMPTTDARQPVGTPIVVVTSTPAAAIATATVARPTSVPATATVPRPTSVPATATAPRPAPTAAKPAGPVVHQVVVGDTLWGIASRYGSTVEAIMRANRLPDADSIVLGAKLVIPR